VVAAASASLWLPAGLVILLWWASTGVVLRFNRLHGRHYGQTMLATSIVAVLGLALVQATAHKTSLGAQLLAFCGMLALWAWMEVSYYLGYLTGLSERPCPPGTRLGHRFLLAVQASLYHELAVIAGAVVILLLSWNAPNQTAFWCYCVLWLMRWSTKLNIFFGVSNINEGWLPPRLRYLGSFYEKRAMNVLFPLSVTTATLVLAAVLFAIPSAPPALQVSYTLVATLLALGLLEHWFLVIPLPNAELWEPVFGRDADSSAAPQDAETGAAPERPKARASQTTIPSQPLAAGGSSS